MYFSCFPIILGYFALPDEVGRYTASDKIVRCLISFILVPTITSFYPKVGRLATQNYDQAVTLVRNIFIVVFALTFCLMAAMFVFAPYVPYLLGDDYQGTEKMIRVMTIAGIFIASGGVTGQLGLLAIGGKSQKRFFSRVYIYAAIVSLISVAILSPVLLGLGASIAILITEAFVAIMMTMGYIRMLKKAN